MTELESGVRAAGRTGAETGPAAFAATDCVGTSGGFGLVASYGGSLSAERFAVEDVSLCGVLLSGTDATDDAAYGASSLDLSAGVISRTSVGVCMQVGAYNWSRLQNGVEYRDVRAPIQATTYELPMSLESRL